MPANFKPGYCLPGRFGLTQLNFGWGIRFFIFFIANGRKNQQLFAKSSTCDAKRGNVTAEPLS
jgi:hypothetical protein